MNPSTTSSNTSELPEVQNSAPVKLPADLKDHLSLVRALWKEDRKESENHQKQKIEKSQEVQSSDDWKNSITNLNAVNATPSNTEKDCWQKLKSYQVITKAKQAALNIKEHLTKLTSDCNNEMKPSRICVCGPEDGGKSGVINGILCAPFDVASDEPAAPVVREFRHWKKDGGRAVDSNQEPRHKVGFQFLSVDECMKVVKSLLQDCQSATAKREGLDQLEMIYGKEQVSKIIDAEENGNVNTDNITNGNGVFNMNECEKMEKFRKLHQHDNDIWSSSSSSSSSSTSENFSSNSNLKKINDLATKCGIGFAFVGQEIEVELFFDSELDLIRKVEEKYWPIIKSIKLGSDFPILCLDPLEENDSNGVSIVYVPEFGDANPVREKIAEDLLENATKILICLDADRELENFEKDAVRKLQAKCAGRDSITFVATKADGFGQSDVGEFDRSGTDSIEDHRKNLRNEVRQKFKKMLDDPLKDPIFVTSPKDFENFLETIRGGDQSPDVRNSRDLEQGWSRR